MSNYNSIAKKIDICTQEYLNNKSTSNLLLNNTYIIKSRKAYETDTSSKDLLKQIKDFCKGRFVDTQCFAPSKEIVVKDENGFFAGYKRVSLVTISPIEDFRIKWHLNYTYNSTFVNWYNLQEIIEHFAPDYPRNDYRVR